MKLLILAIFLVMAMPASAQSVYKCAKGKDVSYQSQPCADSTPVKAWDATPEPPPTNAELWRRYYARKQGERDSAYLRSLAGRDNGSVASGASIGTTQSSYGCESAKRSRQATLDAVGLNRTHDLLRSLDDAVNRACK